MGVIVPVENSFIVIWYIFYLFLDFLSFLHVAVKKDLERVVCQSEIELQERHLGINTWRKRPLTASLCITEVRNGDSHGLQPKMGGGGKVGSNWVTLRLSTLMWCRHPQCGSFLAFLRLHAAQSTTTTRKKIHEGAGIYRNPRYVSSVNDKFDKLRLQRRSNFDKVLGELLSCYLKVQFQSSDSLSTSTTSPPGTLQMGLLRQSLARV